MDESLILHYYKKAISIRKKRKYPSPNNLDDLIRFLKIEQEVEQFQFDIEHAGDSPDWRVLALANLVGKPMVSASLMIDLLSKIQVQNKNVTKEKK